NRINHPVWARPGQRGRDGLGADSPAVRASRSKRVTFHRAGSGRGVLPARCWEDQVDALHEDVELQRVAGEAFVVQGGHYDGVGLHVPGLVEGVFHGELPVRAGGQVQLLHLAVAPVDADAVVLDRRIGDLAREGDLLEGQALNDRGVDGRHALGDVE